MRIDHVRLLALGYKARIGYNGEDSYVTIDEVRSRSGVRTGTERDQDKRPKSIKRPRKQGKRSSPGREINGIFSTNIVGYERASEKSFLNLYTCVLSAIRLLYL